VLVGELQGDLAAERVPDQADPVVVGGQVG